MIDIRIAEDSDGDAWESFIAAHAVDHHAFDWRWRSVLRRTFGHRPYYLMAHEAGTLVGVLPLIFLKSFLFGRSLVSLPYLNGGGVLANNSDVFYSLVEKAIAIGRECRAQYIELRHRSPIADRDPVLQERTHKAAMRLPLIPDAEAQFNSFPAKLRSQIRRPSKSGLVAEIISGREVRSGTINSFYSVFARNMRDLGTPVYPRELFANTLEAFADTSKVILISKDRVPVAAGITIGWRDTVEIPWASSLRAYNNLAPNMLLYWEAIRAASDSNYTAFDFGRSSKDSGPYRFKEQWGATPVDLFWYAVALSRDGVPDVNPNSPRFRALVGCWRRLPLSVANTFGPWITRSLP